LTTGNIFFGNQTYKRGKIEQRFSANGSIGYFFCFAFFQKWQTKISLTSAELLLHAAKHRQGIKSGRRQKITPTAATAHMYRT